MGSKEPSMPKGRGLAVLKRCQQEVHATNEERPGEMGIFWCVSERGHPGPHTIDMTGFVNPEAE